MTEDHTAADCAAEEDYFAGPRPYLDDVTDAAEQICTTLTERSDTLDAAFAAARLCLEESADIGGARSQLQFIQATVTDALHQLDRLDTTHRVAAEAGIDETKLATTITQGCATVADPNHPAPQKTALSPELMRPRD